MKQVPVDKSLSNKDRIVEVALGLFNTHGVGTVTTNEIAAVAGVSPGNLYYHFANKYEIVRALLPRIDVAFDASFDYDEIELLSVERLVKDYVDGIALLWDYRFFFGGLNELVRADAAIADFYNRFADRAQSEMVRFYVKMIRDGQMRLPGSRARIDDLARKTLLIWFSIMRSLQARQADEDITRADIIDGGLLCFFDVEPYLDADLARTCRRKLEALRLKAEQEKTPASVKKTGVRR